MLMEVAPNMRRHVVGPQGETLRKLTQEYPSVRVMVPPPSDTQSRNVTIRGTRDEVSAVEGCIRAHLQAVEQRLLLKARKGPRRAPQATASTTLSLHSESPQHGSKCQS